MNRTAVVFVGAHPDDDINAGGYLAQAAAGGARVICIFLTRGEAGQVSHPHHDAAAVRTAEQQHAASILGVSECIFLDYLGFRDGDCRAASPRRAIQELAAIFTRLAPDVIITFDDGGLTGHDDHAVAGYLTTEARRRAVSNAKLLKLVATHHFQTKVAPHLARLGAMMDPDRPRPVAAADTSLTLTVAGALLGIKLQAYRAHASQSLEPGLGQTVLLHWLRHEAYIEV